MMPSAIAPPARPAPDLTKYPTLSKEQAGHIRHIHNLASLPPGEWAHMFTAEPSGGEEFIDALRYQIATMTYAASVAHYHRLPALRSVFKVMIKKLISQMLRKEVWSYWFNTSMSGVRVDPDLKELRKPWGDPLKQENIMYSGHLLLMVSLYAMLFDDDEFEKEHSIILRCDQVFWDVGPETFRYSTSKLQRVILDDMEQNDWVGARCEPNMVSVVCNQFPLIAMRYNDVRNGTNKIQGILERYRAAWTARGGLAASDGLVRDSWMVEQGKNRDAKEWAFSAWNDAFMHAWNAEKVEDNFRKQARGNIVKIGGVKSKRYILNTVEVATEFRKLVGEQSMDPESPDTQAAAVALAKRGIKLNEGGLSSSHQKPILGYALQVLSELPGVFAENAKTSLLEYVDKLNPTWENGGLYYPRNDTKYDGDMNWTFVSRFDGNAAIAYARLNVVDGQKIMWEQPWTRSALQSRPFIEEVGFEDGIDFLRAVWDEEEGLLLTTMRTWEKGVTSCVRLCAKNLPTGTWELWIGGKLIRVLETTHKEFISIEETVGNKVLDIALRRA